MSTTKQQSVYSIVVCVLAPMRGRAPVAYLARLHDALRDNQRYEWAQRIDLQYESGVSVLSIPWRILADSTDEALERAVSQTQEAVAAASSLASRFDVWVSSIYSDWT